MLSRSGCRSSTSTETNTTRIDPASNTRYGVSKSEDSGGTFYQRLHALDLATGNEKFSAPPIFPWRRGSLPWLGYRIQRHQPLARGHLQHLCGRGTRRYLDGWRRTRG